MKPHSLRKTLTVALGLALLALTGCPRPGADRAPESRPSGPVAVTVIKPVKKTLVHKIEQPGEVRGFEEAPIYARVSGYVSKVHKDIGDAVKTGDLLAELDVPELKEELEQKKGLVAQAETEIEQAKSLRDAAEAGVKSAEAKVDEAKAGKPRAQAEFDRAESQYQRLRDSKSVVSKEVLEESRLGVETAKAGLKEVEARVQAADASFREAEKKRDKAAADIAVTQARLKVAQADERRVAALVDYTQIKSRFDGVVIRRRVDRGHAVQVGGPGTEPLFVLASINPVRVVVDTPETDAALVHEGTKATVRVLALRGASFPGQVKRTSGGLDLKSRTLRVEIDLENPEKKLRPGMYVQTTLQIPRENAWAVPQGAVLTQGDQSFVFRVVEGKAVRTPVQTGFRDGALVELVKVQGTGTPPGMVDLSGDEELIVNPPASLQDGQAVTPKAEGK